MDINSENIDEYLLLLLDGELTEAAEKEVMAIVESSPEYKALLDEYMLTKLDDEAIVFEDKAMLLKPETVMVPMRRESIYTAVAAALAVIICAGVLLKMQYNNPEQAAPLATQHTVEKVITDTASEQPLMVKQDHEEERAQRVVKQTSNKGNKVAAPANIAMVAVDPRPQAEELNRLPVAGLKMMDINSDQKIIASEITLQSINDTPPDNAVAINDEDTGRRALLNSLVAQFETMKDNMQEKAKSIRISAVSIQLGNKAFTIGK